MSPVGRLWIPDRDIETMVCAMPENTASLKLAEEAGFTFCGLFDEPEGHMARYMRDV